MRRRLGLVLLLAAGALPPAAGAQTRTNIPTPWRQTGVSFGHRSDEALGYLIGEAADVVVLQVTAVDRDKGAVTFKPVSALKGKLPAGPVRHTVGDKVSAHDRRSFLAWARPGRSAVYFQGEYIRDVCLGNTWYKVDKDATIDRWQEQLTQAYVGPVDTLREHIAAILAGKVVVVTATTTSRRASVPDGLVPRDWLRGQKGHVCRLRASAEILFHDDDEPLDESDEFFARGGDPKAVPKLIERLKEPDAFVRCEAAEGLGQVGPPARDALPALRLALQDGDAHARTYAALALARIDRDDKQAVPALVAALKEKDATVRSAAAAALAELAPRAGVAVPALLKALRDDAGEEVRAASAFAAGHIAVEATDPATPRADVIAALAKALRDDKADTVRYRAIHALRRFGLDAKIAIPALKAEVKGEKYAFSEALDTLGRMGPVAVPALCAALKEVKGADFRCAIMECLEDMGPAAKEAVPILREVMKSDSRRGRTAAAVALMRIAWKSEGKGVTKALQELIEDELISGSAGFRLWGRLAELGPEAREALPVLLTASKKGYGEEVVAVLNRTGLDTKEVVSLLKSRADAVSGADPDVAYALWRRGHKRDAVTTLLRRWWAADERGRCFVLFALADIGPDAAEVVPLLKKELKHEPEGRRERYLRACVALALWRVQEPAEAGGAVFDPRQEALDVLLAMLRDNHIEAIGALEQIGPEAKAAVPGLIKAAKDEWYITRCYAVRALGRVGGNTKDVTGALKAALKDRNSEVRAEAAVALARIDRRSAPVGVMVEVIAKYPSLRRVVGDTLAGLGPDAKAAVPPLLKLLRDEDRALYLEAARVLRKIDPEAAKKAGVP